MGFSEAWILLIRAAIVIARPVLPDPGIPLIAIIRRASSGVEQNFAGQFVSLGFVGGCWGARCFGGRGGFGGGLLGC